MATGASFTTDDKFKKDVLKSDKPVLLDFGAKWCGPCRKLSPIVDKIAKEMEGKIHVFKVDIDKSPETSTKYSVRCVPTLMIFKDGKMVCKEEGLMSEEDLTEWIEENC
jgi:thioredoxin 1